MQESNNSNPVQTSSSNGLGLSIAIIIAAVIIGGAVVYTNKNNPDTTPKDLAKINVNTESKEEKKNIPSITAEDHIKGDINAPIKIVEYSDMECPYCIRLHTTLNQLLEENNDVAWVYRHVPLHRKSSTEATATECVAQLGGNEMFWKYIDRIYSTSSGNDSFDLTQLPVVAKEFGLDTEAFNKCLNESGNTDEFKNSTQDAYAAMRYFGRTDPKTWGTPFSVIITPKGEYYPVFGAQPIEFWRAVIAEIKKQK